MCCYYTNLYFRICNVSAISSILSQDCAFRISDPTGNLQSILGVCKLQCKSRVMDYKQEFAAQVVKGVDLEMKVPF